MLITINNQDTFFTIDTYSTFTAEDSILFDIDNYNQANNTKLDYDDFDFETDTSEVIAGLAKSSIDFIKENCIDAVILGVQLVEGSEHSPKFYNYSTDSYECIYKIDKQKLDNYCIFDTSKNKDFKEYIGNHLHIWDKDEINQYQWKLSFYLESEHKDLKDDYIQTLFADSLCLYRENSTCKVATS